MSSHPFNDQAVVSHLQDLTPLSGVAWNMDVVIPFSYTIDISFPSAQEFEAISLVKEILYVFNTFNFKLVWGKIGGV